MIEMETMTIVPAHPGFYGIRYTDEKGLRRTPIVAWKVHTELQYDGQAVSSVEGVTVDPNLSAEFVLTPEGLVIDTDMSGCVWKTLEDFIHSASDRWLPEPISTSFARSSPLVDQG